MASPVAGSTVTDIAITATKILRIKAKPLSLLVLCQDAFCHSDDHKYILPLTKSIAIRDPMSAVGIRRNHGMSASALRFKQTSVERMGVKRN
jgi:hypothetical protein